VKLMSSIQRKLILAAFLGLLMLAMGFVQTANADSTYIYDGNSLTNFYGGSCHPACEIDGSFTVSHALAANLNNVTIFPSSFSFTDGEITLNNHDTYSDVFADISTNAAGDITSWYIDLEGFGAQIVTTDGVHHEGNFDETITWDGTLSNSNKPGTWTDPSSPTPTPEPSSLLLMGVGLAAVACGIRRSPAVQSSL